MRTVTDPDHSILMGEAISCYEICENDFAYNLICVAQQKHLSLILISLPASTRNTTIECIHNIELSFDYV